MIDFSRIRFDELNVQNGLRFFVSRNPRSVCLRIETIGVGRRRISVTIFQEPNHYRPHVHFDGHSASFAIDNGELLAGHCDAMSQRSIGRWICKHRPDLIQLWDYVQQGGDYQTTLESIRRDKDFEDFGFKGQVPKHKKEVQGVLIWYNGALTIDKDKDGTIKVVCNGDLFVGVPYGVEDGGITFESRNGKLQKKRIESV